MCNQISNFEIKFPMYFKAFLKILCLKLISDPIRRFLWHVRALISFLEFNLRLLSQSNLAFNECFVDFFKLWDQWHLIILFLSRASSRFKWSRSQLLWKIHALLASFLGCSTIFRGSFLSRCGFSLSFSAWLGLRDLNATYLSFVLSGSNILYLNNFCWRFVTLRAKVQLDTWRHRTRWNLADFLIYPELLITFNLRNPFFWYFLKFGKILIL